MTLQTYSRSVVAAIQQKRKRKERKMKSQDGTPRFSHGHDAEGFYVRSIDGEIIVRSTFDEGKEVCLDRFIDLCKGTKETSAAKEVADQ